MIFVFSKILRAKLVETSIKKLTCFCEHPHPMILAIYFTTWC